MFGWLRRRQINKQKKLIFQNGQASELLATLFESLGDAKTTTRLQDFQKENRRIALSVFDGEGAMPEDLRRLLDMNRELRHLHELWERTRGETRVRELMGAPPKRPDFDEDFKPALGWKNFFEHN